MMRQLMNTPRLHGVLLKGFVLIVAVSFLLIGCGGGEKPAENPSDKPAAPEKPAATEKPAADVSAKVAEKIDQAIEKKDETKMETIAEKSTEAKAREAYSYDPINKVDPFAQISMTPDLSGADGKEENVLTKYEIRYFRLVGVVADEAQPRAIFEDPRGRAYVVGVGTPIGRNLGVIEQILSDSVIVTEQRFVPGGTEIENVQLVIKLHPDREKEMQGGG